MSITIKEIADKEDQKEFLQNIDHSPFLQSFAWGSFQKEIGNKVYQLGVFESDKLVGVASSYQIKSKFTSYLYIPWGPVLKKWSKEEVEKLLNRLLEITNKENLDFIRIEPRIISKSDSKVLLELGLKETKSFTQPECTAVIDLLKTEEELLSAMSVSTRYNVRMVERRGVKIRQGDSSDLSIFEKLLKETSKRHHFTVDIHPGYYKKQYEALNQEKMMNIFIAEFNNEPLAAALVVFYGDTATYLHAASTRSQSKLRAPYLLAWKSILEGKSRGCKYFDFWGIAPEEAGEDHPWYGVTSFKMSFGCERACYAPVFDFPTSSRYKLAKLVDLIRKPAKKILKIQ